MAAQLVVLPWSSGIWPFPHPLPVLFVPGKESARLVLLAKFTYSRKSIAELAIPVNQKRFFDIVERF